MGLLSLFTKADKSEIAIIDTDLTFEVPFISSESHSWSNSITSYPVEKGGNITDHIEPNQDVYTISGLVSDAPIDFFDLVGGVFSDKPTQTALDFFRNLAKTRSVVEISSKFFSYPSMLCKEIRCDRAAGSGERLSYSIDFIEAQFADTLLTDLGDITKVTKSATGAIKKKGTGALQKNVGKKAATAAAPSTAAKGASILANYLGVG